MLLGSGFGALLAHTLTPVQMEAWGWRLPFLLGALVAITGVVIRRDIGADVIDPEVKAPVRQTFGRFLPQVLRVMALNIASSVGYYSVFVYAVSYVEEIDQLTAATSLSLNTGVLAVLLLLYPISAWISDRIGRKPMLISGAAILCFGSVPLFALLHSQDPQQVLRGELGLTVAVALLAGGKNPANVELMPAAVRCTGLAVAFNVAEGYFGGTTPLIATWLIAQTGNPLSPGVWVAFSGLCTLITVVVFTRETAFRPLSYGNT
jgi:MHS family proline/betaine transporter-like MFS transporter